MDSCKNIVGYLSEEVFGVFRMEGCPQFSEMYLRSSAILAKSDFDLVLLYDDYW